MEQYHRGAGARYWVEIEEGHEKSVNPHEVEDTTTIEIAESLKEYLQKYSGRNYSERIASLDWKQNCSKAGTDSCNKKATNALRMKIGPDLFVAVPLCGEHLEDADVPNLSRVEAVGEHEK